MSDYKKTDKGIYLEDRQGKAEITYSIYNGVMRVDHTFVPDSMRGKGIAKKLVLEVIDYAKENNYKIEPVCSYVVSFFEKNKGYEDLIAV